jgi:hypothetical protein
MSCTRKAKAAWSAARNEADGQGRWYSTHCHAPKGSTIHKPHGAKYGNRAPGTN